MYLAPFYIDTAPSINYIFKQLAVQLANTHSRFNKSSNEDKNLQVFEKNCSLLCSAAGLQGVLTQKVRDHHRRRAAAESGPYHLVPRGTCVHQRISVQPRTQWEKISDRCQLQPRPNPNCIRSSCLFRIGIVWSLPLPVVVTAMRFLGNSLFWCIFRTFFSPASIRQSRGQQERERERMTETVGPQPYFNQHCNNIFSIFTQWLYHD